MTITGVRSGRTTSWSSRRAGGSRGCRPSRASAARAPLAMGARAGRRARTRVTHTYDWTRLTDGAVCREPGPPRPIACARRSTGSPRWWRRTRDATRGALPGEPFLLLDLGARDRVLDDPWGGRIYVVVRFHRVEPHLVTVRVVQHRQDPADGREVHACVLLPECAQVVREPSRRRGPARRWRSSRIRRRRALVRETGRGRARAAVGMGHRHPGAPPVLAELDHAAGTRGTSVPGDRSVEVGHGQLEVVDTRQGRDHRTPFSCSRTAILQLHCTS